MLTKLLCDLLIVALKLYFTSKKSRKVPTQKDRDIFNLCRKKGIALNTIDPMRMFAEVIGDIKRILKFDLGKNDVAIPLWAVSYLGSRFRLDLRLLEESIFNNNKEDIKKNRKQTYKSRKKIWQNSKKCAFGRSGALSLVARYHWLNGKQNKAVKFWKKAIEEGGRLGARPDLARTYMGIGKRFLEEKSKYEELNGIKAKEYLEKARTMFKEMDLQFDLDKLDKIAADV